MIKLFIGSIAAAVAMFIAAFLYFAGPLSMVAYSTASESQSAAVQTALAANLPETGTYMVPNPATQSGTILYGKGPVATVHFNTAGFPVESTEALLWGFILYFVVALLIAAALSQFGSRVPDFRSRATVVVLFAIAMPALSILTDPIFLHQDWSYSIFGYVGSVLILGIGGLVIARWFMPSAPAQAKEPAGGEEVGAV